MTDLRGSSGWADLPGDLLGLVFPLLELPEALAAAAVCSSWCSAAAAAGVPRSHTPWLVHWEQLHLKDDTIEFRNLLSAEYKTRYKVNLLQAGDELSNLVLCNPFTFDTIPLPPITDFECVKGVYDTEGGIVGYRYGKDHQRFNPATGRLGRWFYQKVVLSCDPSSSSSHGGDYTAIVVHYDGDRVSFARAREGRWRLAAALSKGERYADCVYHDGRLFTVTLRGVIEMWDLNGPHEPTKQVIIADGDKKCGRVLTRFLVSTPSGSLLQIRTLRTRRQACCPVKIEVEILEVDVEEGKLVGLSSSTALREYAVFVGLNHSACLPTKEFPELRPNCVYFTTPHLVNHDNFGLPGWVGVVIYGLENQMFEDVPASFGYWTSAIWYIPNI
ncbi:hypothetical protein BRADI_5g20265v3 [Brachypodium distachyon]|uniref:KIB1-4 beta-propeller domain-containing protein n=1 Tax=Brachypodium distachyon TaxID=15368 RepID=A0A0Q3P5Z6_BRADI|nr:hypothetical protein BRADI_5g20265v3 [Brachypodium distachyon]